MGLFKWLFGGKHRSGGAVNNDWQMDDSLAENDSTPENSNDNSSDSDSDSGGDD